MLLAQSSIDPSTVDDTTKGKIFDLMFFSLMLTLTYREVVQRPEELLSPTMPPNSRSNTDAQREWLHP